MISCQWQASLFATWTAVLGFFDSPFVSAFLSALSGAGLGAWAAHQIAEKAARRAELLSALRQSNAVLVLAYTVANNTLGLKSQHVSALTDRYAAERELAVEAAKQISQGKEPQTSRAQADLMKITPHSLPLDALKNLIFSGNAMPGKALALATMVDQCAAELNQVLSLRNEFIDEFKSSRVPEYLKWHDYFGLTRPDGNTNNMYANCMQALKQYTDDLIFFSSELAAELSLFSKRVKGKLDALGAESPEASSVDFSDAMSRGLMPAREGYESWLSGVQTGSVASG